MIFFLTFKGEIRWNPAVADWISGQLSCSAALSWSCDDSAGVGQKHHNKGQDFSDALMS